jgi:hypothetical protein
MAIGGMRVTMCLGICRRMWICMWDEMGHVLEMNDTLAVLPARRYGDLIKHICGCGERL